MIFCPVETAQQPRHSAIGGAADLAYSTLINREVLEEIGALKDQLLNCASAPSADTRDLQARMQRVARLLTHIAILADVQQQPPIFALGDRVSLPDILADVLDKLPRLRAEVVPLASDGGAPHDAATLYARRHWLQAALQALLEIQQNGGAHTAVRLRVTQREGFVTLSCTVDAASPRPEAGHAAAADAGVAQAPSPSLDPSLIRHIIDLHGGQLDMPLATQPKRGAGGFRLTLPTGVPPHGFGNIACKQCIYPGFVQVMARDLGRLMPKKSMHSHVSSEEMQLLEELYQGLSAEP